MRYGVRLVSRSKPWFYLSTPYDLCSSLRLLLFSTNQTWQETKEIAVRHPLPFLLGAVEISTTHFLPNLIWLLVFVNNSETPVFFARAEGTQPKV